MFKEKYFSLVMAMSLVVNMFFPFSSAKAAYDAQYDISSGNVAITANGSYRVYGTTASNTISVSSGLTNVSITLDNVSIALGSTKDISPILINGNSQVTINLSGSNILTSYYDTPAIQVSKYDDSTIGTLTIEGTGSLTATGGKYGAGIGGGKDYASGNIIINSGKITATGGSKGAGIGGGCNMGSTYIQINGGTVKAIGEDGAAGIGGGYGGGSSYIEIADGTVKAEGEQGGAGIGGGYKGSGGTIALTGGSVVGISGEYGYGIGCGRYVEGSSISIGSADVSAFSEEGTSAIELDAITGSAIVFSGKFLSDFYSSDETFTFTCGSYQKQITFPAGCKYFSTTLSQQGEYSISDSNGAFTGKLDSTYVSTFSVTSGYDIFTVYPSVEYTLSEPTLTVDDIVLSSSQTTKSITLSAKSASVTMAENAKGSKPSVSYSYAIKEDSAKIASLSGSKLTVTVSKAGNYSIVVTATATAGALQTSVDATINVIKQNQTINLSNIDENVTISSNGVYTITGSTTRYNVNVNSALDDVTLVLSGATIDLSKNSGTTTTPIIVGAGSSVTLISSGTTTLKNRIKGTPIKLEDGDSSYPTKLFVKSSGKLYMENEYTGVGILGGGSNTQVYMLTGNARITTVDGAGISVGNLFVSDLSYMKILTESSKVKPVIATMITDDYDDYTAAYVLQANLSKSLDVSTTTLTVKNSDTKKYITIDDFLDDYMGFAVVLPSSGVYTVKYENGDIDRYLTHTMEKTVVLREFTVDEYLDYFTFAYSTCKCKLSAPTFKIDNVSVPYDTSSKRFTLNADGATFKHDDKCDIHSSNSSIDYSYSIEEDDDEICTLDGAKLTVHPSEPGKYAVKVRVTVSVDDISVTKDASFTVTKLTEDQTAELRGQDHKPYINGYEDSTFRPDNNLTRAEVSTMMVTVMGYSGSVNFESTFSDIDKKAWYFEDVSRMQYEGIFSGYEDGTFKPDNYITRAEFCVIIYNAMKIDSSKSSSKSAFTDVKGHWAEKYISALIQKKYISGYDAKTFMPDKPITRAEAVTIINRALDRSANKEKIQAVDPTNPYKDLTKSHWAYYEIIEASVRHYAKEWHK